MIVILNRFLILTFCFICFYPVPAKSIQQVSDTSDIENTVLDLLFWINANSIVKNSEAIIEVFSDRRMKYRVEKTITILNQEGSDNGNIAIYYNSFMKPKRIKGEIRDKNNNLVRTLSSKEINDYSNAASYSLFEDSRVLFFQLLHHEYPYTISYEYEVDYSGYINWPMWFPQDYGMAVDQAKLTLSVPAGMEVRYRLNNMEAAPDVSTDNRRDIYSWVAERLVPVTPEPYGPKNYMQLPFIELAPNQFEMDGYKGKLQTWESFGQWYANLSQGRDQLSDTTIDHIRSIVQHTEDETEKIKILYNHLQESTRYVNISLGLGGWQTYPASYVEERGYGDCKALTNYMIAMLNAIGVESYPALIRSGINERELDPDFPSNQFNHVVAFIPRNEDDLWLECTSKIMPFGYLGMSNEDRYALVVKPEGGKLVRTPKSTWEDNQQFRTATVDLLDTGDAFAEVTTQFTGNKQLGIRNSLSQLNISDQHKWIRRWINIPAFDLLSADLSNFEKKESVLQLPLTLKLPGYGTTTGKRMFVNANLMEQGISVPPEIENRTQPVHLNYEWINIDSIYFKIPDNFIVEAMPEPVLIETDFAYYSAALSQPDENTLLYHRELQIREKYLPAELYNDYREFYSLVARADKMRFLLKKESD
ncbi:MAG: DUF3857 domain-containing transglutaminase family protein [Balneolaceae bacterium]